MSRGPRRAFAAAALALAFPAPGCGRDEPPAVAPPRPSAARAAAPVAPPAPEPPRHVGSEACGACHPDELTRWRASHHAKAMLPAGDESVLGDFSDARFAKPGVTSTMTRRDGRFVLRTDGPDGALHDYEVAYTFGLDPLQQYLVPFPDGRMQATSLAWDARPKAEGGQRWFDLQGAERIPPTDPLHWTSAAGQWNALCAECHSTNVRKGWRAEEARYETTWSEVSVGCEACHGPGAEHVAWAEDTPPGARRARAASAREAGLSVSLRTDGATWSIAAGERIARRSAPRDGSAQLDACGRCHARRAPLTDGAAAGIPLLDTHRPALLEAGLYFDDGQIRDEVYEWGSFLQSRMHAAGVACSDCHDAHAGTPKAEGNALCGACHDAVAFDTAAHHHHRPGTEAARCTSCHMPARTYMTVDVRHDHSLRVPRPDLTHSLGTPNACAACHAKEPASWAAKAIARWRAPDAPPPRPHFAEALHAARNGAAGAAAALAALAADEAQPAIARATAVAELAAWPGAAAEAAIGRAARDDDALLRLAAADALQALAPSSRIGVGAPLLRDVRLAVRLSAARVLAGAPPELWSPSQRDDLARALAELRESHRAHADRPESLVSLGALHATLGELAEARRAYETSIRLAPYFVPAYANLADLARAEGDDAEADALLARALAVAPGDATLQHAVGLLRVRQGRLPEAVEILGRAAAAAPESPRYTVVYAVALHEAGRSAEALRQLEDAHRRRPGEREVLLTLASLARDTGDRMRALEAARTLAALDPGDPSSSALLRELEAP